MNRRKLLTGSLAGALAAGEAHAQATKAQPQAAAAGPGGGETIYVPITVAVPAEVPRNDSFSCTVELAAPVDDLDGLVMVDLSTNYPDSVGVSPIFIPAGDASVTIFLSSKNVAQNGVVVSAVWDSIQYPSGELNVV